MARIPKTYTAKEILNILNKQWLNTKDIQIISGTGIDKARKIKQAIACQVKDEGYYLPDGLVPTDKAISYLNINISYLKKISNIT